MKLLLIDNYDSFTYNLYHLLRALGADVTVVRNDKVKMGAIADYDKIVLSPGPGIPSEAGQLMEVISTYHTTKPILGVCLGHQAIGEAFGATLTNLSEVFHGVQSHITHYGNHILFDQLPTQLSVGRYHSWVVDSAHFPTCLTVTAVSAEGQIMALKHNDYEVHGIQFHPESVLTPEGMTMIKNFLYIK